MEAANLADDADVPLFRSFNRRTGELDRAPLHRANAWDMVRRRARRARLKEEVCNHADTRTTRLELVTIDDVSRIRIFSR
jgi:hypothetical protein